MAAGRAAARAGEYSGARTLRSRVSRLRLKCSGRPVTGWLTLITRGRLCSRAAHSARSLGYCAAQPLVSFSQACRLASSAAWPSVEKLAGSTMSGGATPSITVRRTLAGNWRRYSSAARVP